MGLMKSDTSYEGLVASKWQLASFQSCVKVG